MIRQDELDRPELRGKRLRLLIEALKAAEMRQSCTDYGYYAEILDKQLLTLIPDEEEIRKQERERIMSDKKKLWKALKEAGLDQDRVVVTMASILLSINGLENSLEFVRERHD